MDEQTLQLSVSEFITLTNQTLEYAYPSVAIEGEVASFKVNQGKYVFFDLKDQNGSVGCFMTVWQLRQPIEDGMKVIVVAVPKLTQWGKFSLTVRSIRLSGEGALKKSFQLLQAKLEAEGLFAIDRKRPLPALPSHIGVISSTQAAGYTDFIKILGDRWGGLKIDVAHTQVQGAEAPDQIIRALRYFNEQTSVPDVLVIVRGGGSADDLSAFNDEQLVRAVAASRVPVLTGIGHEVDESLVDLAADMRASTPSNAAQILVPDRQEIRRTVKAQLLRVIPTVERIIQNEQLIIEAKIRHIFERTVLSHQTIVDDLATMRRIMLQLDPMNVLKRGYALVRGEQKIGATVEIETNDIIMKTEVKDVQSK